MRVYATMATWAWVHAQLDLNKKFKIHLLDNFEDKTLCGRETSSAWEFMDEIEEWFPNEFICERCLKAEDK